MIIIIIHKIKNLHCSYIYDKYHPNKNNYILKQQLTKNKIIPLQNQSKTTKRWQRAQANRTDSQQDQLDSINTPDSDRPNDSTCRRSCTDCSPDCRGTRDSSRSSDCIDTTHMAAIDSCPSAMHLRRVACATHTLPPVSLHLGRLNNVDNNEV